MFNQKKVIMKKIYTLLLAVLVAGGAFAQTMQVHSFQKMADPSITSKNAVKPVVSNVSSQSKDINATLNQNFDIISFPPASWAVTSSSAATAWYNSGNATVVAYESAATPTGHFAYFDCFNLPNNASGTLVTPTLHPTAASNTLSYKVNLYLLNTSYLMAGAKMYIEFSTDGGTTWTTSTTNVLATLPNYNVTSSGWVTQTASLAAYNGGTVKVRFRGVSDYGGMGLGIDDVTGPEADVVSSVNDIQVLGTFADFGGSGYYMVTPLTQATDANLCGAVVNAGSAAQTNVTLHAEDAINAITGTTVIASQPSGQTDTMVYVATLDNANAKNYGFKMYATQTQTDEIPLNNAGDSIYFSTDPSMYARTMNYNTYLTSYSYAASGAPAITGMEYGCNYLFMNDDKIDTMFVFLYGANGTGTITGKLYNVDLSTGARTVVAQTAPYTPGAAPEFAVLPLTSFYNVTAPAYLTATMQMNLNVTTAPRDTIKILADGNFPGDAAMADIIYIKVGTTWGWYTTNSVPVVGLIIDRPTGISNNALLSKDVFVYPNPVSNTLYVMNKTAKSVEIYNLAGQVVASYANQNVIDVTSLAKGEYLVKVVTESKVITEKINIVH